MGVPEDTSEDLEVVAVGIALLMVQSVIVTNPFFGEQEIRKFILLRRVYYRAFASACANLADKFESGEMGENLKSLASPLRMVSRMSVSQDRTAMVQVVKILRGMRHLNPSEVPMPIWNLIRTCMVFGLNEPVEEDSKSQYQPDLTHFFQSVIKVSGTPPQVKTLLRKAIQLGHKENGGRLLLEPHESDNPGAWFDMPQDQKETIRKSVQQAEEDLRAPIDGHTPDQLRERWDHARDVIQKAQREAGVHRGIICSEDQEPMDVALKRDEKVQRDGVTDFLSSKLRKSIREYASRNPSTGKPLAGLPQPVRKVLTTLAKVNTLTMFERVLKDAVDRKLLPDDFLEEVQKAMQTANRNLAIQGGMPLTPIQWSPKTVEEFQSLHNVGNVMFEDDVPKEDQEETLGRVSAAITQLEGVFGQGFCGKHALKLDFSFKGPSGAFSRASYFAHNDPKEWHPRVTFGEDYEGLLAHELGHYFADLMGYKMSLKTDPEFAEDWKSKGYGLYTGPGDVFGNVGQPMDTVAKNWNNPATERARKHIEAVPELAEFTDAVVKLPEYGQWCDMISAAFESMLNKAVSSLTGGKYPWDLPEDHPYHGVENAKLKSELPPELVTETEKLYRKMMDGDDRSLRYLQSGPEVWARMCEQYVYTKLSKVGVANPWLTQVSYEDPMYVDQSRFEETLMPIMDRLFMSLGTKNIMAHRIAVRYLQAYIVQLDHGGIAKVGSDMTEESSVARVTARYLSKTSGDVQHVEVKNLPHTLLPALKAVGYNRADIRVYPRSSYSPQVAADDGRKGFTVAVDLQTGYYKEIYGSYGSEGTTQVDMDRKEYPIPPNCAVIQGQTANNHPVYATIYVHPDNLPKLLPSGNEEELDPKLLLALRVIKIYTSSARKEYFLQNHLGAYGPTNPLIQELAKMGLLKVSSTGVAITTAGKNKAGDQFHI